MKKIIILTLVILSIFLTSCAVEEKVCEEKWKCDSWSACLEDQQTRTCNDLNSCQTTRYKPAETKACGEEALETYDETAYTGQANFFAKLMNKMIESFS